MGFLGDPRIERGKWQGVTEDALGVIYQWLTGATLEQFIEILNRGARVDHWKYRRDFWLAYYRMGVVDQAWLALGGAAQEHARRAFNKGYGAGKLVGSGVQFSHSVLLLRIGPLVIADWSHTGKCRIWFENDSNAPHLYRDEYSRPDLTTGSEMIVASYQDPGISHLYSDRGTWQSALADFIRRQTNINVTPQQYMG